MSGCLLEKLQAWYLAHCDGEWEHGYGIKLDTLDNPGWWLTINLQGTSYAKSDLSEFNFDKSDDDWCFCKIKDETFFAHASANNLKLCMRAFFSLVEN